MKCIIFLFTIFIVSNLSYAEVRIIHTTNQSHHTINRSSEAGVCVSCLDNIDGYRQVADLEKVLTRVCLDSALNKTNSEARRFPLVSVELSEDGKSIEGLYEMDYGYYSYQEGSEAVIVSCQKTENDKWVMAGGRYCFATRYSHGCTRHWGIEAE